MGCRDDKPIEFIVYVSDGISPFSFWFITRDKCVIQNSSDLEIIGRFVVASDSILDSNQKSNHEFRIVRKRVEANRAAGVSLAHRRFGLPVNCIHPQRIGQDRIDAD